MKTFIGQLKDADPSDFDLLAIIKADCSTDAVAKLAKINELEFYPSLVDEYQVHQLDELTNCFYNDDDADVYEEG